MTTTPTSEHSTRRVEQAWQYIRDMRDLLGRYGSQDGPGSQAYRDRWSTLCRGLCDERGQPHLTVIQGGGAPPARRLAIFDSEPA